MFAVAVVVVVALSDSLAFVYVDGCLSTSSYHCVMYGSLGEDETRWTGISLRDQGAEVSSAQKFFECFGAQIP